MLCLRERALLGFLQAAVLAGGQPPQFKSETTLVRVPVVVRNRDGRAVGNLRVVDFRLFDNRKEQSIVGFDVEEMLASRSRSEPSSAPTDRFVAYLVDDLNLVPQDLVNGRAAALRQMETLPPSTRAAVYTTSRRVTLGFTADLALARKSLLAVNSQSRESTWLDPTLRCAPMTYYKADLIVAGDMGAISDCLGPYDHARGSNLANASPSRSDRRPPMSLPVTLSRPSSPVPVPEESKELQNAVRMDAESVLQRSDRDLKGFLNTLGGLVQAMGELPGERLIVVLSPGTYVPRRFRPVREAIIEQAIRSRVIISGVDVRGAYNGFPTGPDPTTGNNRYGLGESNERAGFMTDLAQGTGGVFLRGNNDLDLQLRRAAAIPEYVYVLTFSPRELRSGDKPHTLSVRLRNARGLLVQSRTRYLVP